MSQSCGGSLQTGDMIQSQDKERGLGLQSGKKLLKDKFAGTFLALTSRSLFVQPLSLVNWTQPDYSFIIYLLGTQNIMEHI